MKTQSQLVIIRGNSNNPPTLRVRQTYRRDRPDANPRPVVEGQRQRFAIVETTGYETAEITAKRPEIPPSIQKSGRKAMAFMQHGRWYQVVEVAAICNAARTTMINQLAALHSHGLAERERQADFTYRYRLTPKAKLYNKWSPTESKILNVMCKGRSYNVTQVANMIGKSRASASHALRQLHKARVVIREERVFRQLNNPRSGGAVEFLYRLKAE